MTGKYDNSLSMRARRYWLSLALLMLGLSVVGIMIIHAETRQELEQAQELAQQESQLLQNLTNELLQSGEYDSLQPLLDEWASNYPDIAQISIIAANGFIIASVGQPVAPANSLQASVALQYGYRGQATLVLEKDLASLTQHTTQTWLLGLATWILAGLFGIYLVINLVRHQRENIRLEELGRHLGQLNEKITTEQQLLRSLIDSIPDLIFFKDRNSVYLGCNRAYELYAGRTEAELIGKTDFDLYDEEKARLFRSDDLVMLKSGAARRSETWVRFPDKRRILLDSLKTPYHDSQGNIIGFISISRDITDIKHYQEQLEELAYHDPLTHLPNRRFLIDRIQLSIAQADRHASKLAICAIDLDGFKPVNDRYGHDAGDRILTEFANRLSSSLRSEDTVARWGGDEFTVLFTDIHNVNECIELVERLQQLIGLPYQVDNDTVRLSASFGLTIYPDDHSDADTLLRHADQAMYDAKLAGKNGYQFFDPEQNRQLHDHHERRGRLKQAIHQNELVLYYQPQIHLRQGAPYGVEALVRWLHPERGMLMPADFLPLVEDHPMSLDLDWWVIITAIEQLSNWLEEGNFFHLSINVSAMTFQHAEFEEKLFSLIEATPHVEAEMITLELLETAALGNLDAIASKMYRCQHNGLQFSLDDFGTGYSSLTYLSRLPADILKIDQTFVRDMLVDSGDLSIVEGIIKLASAFNRMVIAEGVEEIMHGIRLIELGCQYAQGYSIAKPMPAIALQDWLNHFEPPRDWLKAGRPTLSVLNGHENGKNDNRN